MKLKCELFYKSCYCTKNIINFTISLSIKVLDNDFVLINIGWQYHFIDFQAAPQHAPPPHALPPHALPTHILPPQVPPSPQPLHPPSISPPAPQLASLSFVSWIDT